ncbi:NifB/NifX family molybdenum-iron cluster-binding protein [Candidatus Woesearchaeota archaeon]|nr:NifB/NifX family molybdenum-iron cluster-binding protein [Candidatus Woesearchaeota archaeon]
MKIVISSNGESLESDVDMRFGRCKYFIVVETENKEIKNFSAVENQGALQGHGAGIKAAEQIGELKANAIITGNLGPNASTVLNQLNIDCYQAIGTVKDAVNNLLQGKLKKINSIVQKHFGMR